MVVPPNQERTTNHFQKIIFSNHEQGTMQSFYKFLDTHKNKTKQKSDCIKKCSNNQLSKSNNNNVVGESNNSLFQDRKGWYPKK